MKSGLIFFSGIFIGCVAVFLLCSYLTPIGIQHRKKVELIKKGREIEKLAKEINVMIKDGYKDEKSV